MYIMGFDSDVSSDDNIQSKIGNHLPKIEENKKIHKCNYLNCNKTFARPSKLRRHFFTHIQIKPFVCHYSDCDKSYSYKSHLKRHINSVHEKPLYVEKCLCPYEGCSKEFSSEFNLRRHIKHIHSTTTPVLKYQCSRCPQQFRKKCQLATHNFTHTGIKELKCEKCIIKFENINDLKKHLANHKTYTCDCGEIFHRWSIFLIHKRTQHVNSYTCTICSRIFSTKRYLKIHEQIHNDTRAVFQCEHDGCPRYYYYSKNLIQHVKSFHNAKRFLCSSDKCGRSFVTNQKLKQHLKTHDPNWICRRVTHRKRKPRKDAGIPKKTMALHLAGINYGTDIDDIKDLLNSDTLEDVKEDMPLECKSVSGVLNILSTC